MRVRRKRKVDPLPESFATIQEAAEFWDTHDATDYLEYTRPVANIKFKIQRRHYLLALDAEVVHKLDEVARQRGVSSEKLANLWLSEKLNGLAVKARKRRSKNGRNTSSRT